MKKNIFISFYKTKWIKSLHFAMYKNLRAANVTNRFIFVMFLLVLTSCKQDNIIEPIPPCLDCPINFKVVDSEPAWSPDGKTIVYIHGDINPAKHGLYLIDTSGNNNRLLLNGIYFDSPTWSPDGEWIAFSMSSQIYKIKKDGTQLTQLTSKGRNFAPDWGPDTERIAYSNNDCGDQFVPPKENECGKRILNLKNMNMKFTLKYNNNAIWIGDNELVFSTLVWNGEVGDSVWLYKINEEKKEFLFFLHGLSEILFLKYNLLKNELIFTSSLDYTMITLFKVKLDGSSFGKITKSNAFSQDFSPDGNFIVYTKSDTLNGNLWIMTSEGVDIKALTGKGGD